MFLWPPSELPDVEPGGGEPGPEPGAGGRRRANLLRRLLARGARAIARGQRNAGGRRRPLARTPD